ncbi:FAD/NAD(P)-binding domain-containing protein [Punctularia strigosozonata HHB-11173 SS5]|uniref:FAD/NAD(P)-binding domain-containing protein n=1 Tax=Punctularia strigosozonata (strain HHB-11173) TaxID=741275 RepID=UPI000441826B|nr:FAD/NAD(P)-binding domain-containing protein [Punctularia strigosozonata HHB-11173 SS5]EIN05422.1 FAD/NAD(P)-binding domain-containing protein [Punctularia strigosozonata HHB-11173 SS5]
MPPSHIAVLGGGISGLSAAHHLARRYPTTLITLLEKDSRLGGWIRSERMRVSDGAGNSASVLLEVGPRHLKAPTRSRLHSAYVLELVNQLGIEDGIVKGPMPGAPDAMQLVSMPAVNANPSTPAELMLLPDRWSDLDPWEHPSHRLLMRAAFSNVANGTRHHNYDLGNLSKAGRWLKGRSASLLDENVQQYLEKRFKNPVVADILGTAVVHGALAADARFLSVAIAFPDVYRLERLGVGSVVRGLIHERSFQYLFGSRYSKKHIPGELARHGLDTGDLPERLQDTAVFSFKQGLATLTDALEHALLRCENVRLLKGAAVDHIKGHGRGEFLIGITPDKKRKQPFPRMDSPPVSHLISTVPIPTLERLFQNGDRNPNDGKIFFPWTQPGSNHFPYASVVVVNLVFPPSDTPLHPPGLGFLVPRPANGYDSLPNRGILSVSFDSRNVGPAQDYALGEKTRGEVGSSRFTKMSVMLGGPFPLTPALVDPPTVVRNVSTYLGRDLPKPVLSRVHILPRCFPAYTLGHSTKVQHVQKVARPAKVAVVGAGVAGADVDTCVAVARAAALGKWLDE